VLKFLNFIIQTYLIIALAAVFLSIETQVQLGMVPQLQPSIIMIFFAALLEYNIYRFYGYFNYRDSASKEKYLWVSQNFALFVIILVFSVIGFFLTLFFVPRHILIALSPAAAITILYSLPVRGNNKYFFSLRNIPFLKIFLIALVWSITTTYIPYADQGSFYPNRVVILIFIEHFIFVFAIAIPFDIRDMLVDSKAGVKTIPLLFGADRSVKISNASITLFLLLTISHYIHTDKEFLIPAFIISSLFAVIFINFKKLKKTNLYYGLLDGVLLLQGFLVLISDFIF
jgi:4-hydroxybenzoate polyprenyltransferase